MFALPKGPIVSVHVHDDYLYTDLHPPNTDLHRSLWTKKKKESWNMNVFQQILASAHNASVWFSTCLASSTDIAVIAVLT